MLGRRWAWSFAVLSTMAVTAVVAASASAAKGPLSGTWEVPPGNPALGAPVAAGVTLSTTQPLHDVTVALDASGPAALDGPASQAAGDLAPGTPVRVGAAFRVTAEGTGTVTATVRGRTDDGTEVISTATVFFATGAGRAAFSLDGSLDAAAQALALLRPKIGEAAYARRLAALLGGGASERFDSAAAPPGAAPPPTTSVAGTISYQAVNGNKHPARTITVEIRDANGVAGGVLVTTKKTDAAGKYSATVATLRGDGTRRKLFVRAVAQGTGFAIYDPNQTVPQHVDSSAHTATGAPQTIDLTANRTADNNTAFSVADALTSAILYTKRVNGGSLFPSITVSYPDAQGTDFNSTTNTARILRADRFDWDVLLHEYGHFAADRFGIDTSLGGDHTFSENLAETRGKSVGLRLAWSEGFATWFALTAEDALGTAAMAIPRVGDSFYDDTEDSTYHVDLATNSGYAPKGEDNELSVARFLWHTRKDGNLGVADTKMITAMKAAGGDTFSTQLPGVMSTGGAAKFDDSEAVDAGKVKHSNDFGCLATNQAIASKITAPAAGTMLMPETPTRFRWTANGAGPSNRLDRFTVQFWSENWDTKIFESPTLTTTTFLPTAAQWKSIVEGKDKNGKLPAKLNVVVKGTGSHAPATGPYKSCAITVPIGPGIKATPVGSFLAGMPTAPACSGLFPPGADQFTLDGTRLRPNKKYTLAFNDPDRYPVQQLGIYTADAGGMITGQLVTIPKMPGNPAWPLTATPGSGPVARTTVTVTWMSCFRWNRFATDVPVLWGGAGVKPASTVVQKWVGAAKFTAVADVSGGFGGSYTIKCPAATNTVTTTATLFAVKSTTITFPGIDCIPPSSLGGVVTAAPDVGVAGAGALVPDDAEVADVVDQPDGTRGALVVGTG